MKIKNHMKNFIRNNSIKTSYITYVVFFTVIMCVFLLSAIWSVWYLAFRDDYAKSYTDSANTIYESRVYTVLNHLNNFTLNLSTNQDLYLAILDKDISGEEKNRLVSEELETSLRNTDTIVGVEINTAERKYGYFKDEVDISPHTPDIKEKLGKRKLYIDRNCIIGNGKRYFRIGKKLSNFYSGYMVGDIILYVEEEVLSGLYIGSLSDGDDVFITVDDMVISHSDKSQIGKEIKDREDILKSLKINKNDEKKFLINTYAIDKRFLQNDVEMTCVLLRERVIQSVWKLIRKVYVLIFLFVLLSIMIAIRLSQSLTRELRELMKRMGDFKNNMFKDKLFKRNKSKVNEIKQLEDSFEKMLGELKLLIAANEENSEKRRIAELNALQAQINPHFLYNVLDVISWLAKMENQELIEKMVTALSNFYRMGLHNGQNEIPIRDEIEHVKNYVFLQKVRFPDSFHVEFDVDESMMDMKIVKIVLQPLVENSIKHGFRKMPKGGIIKVKGRIIDNNYCEFTVFDNGCGISMSPLGSRENESRGYGVKNVNERLIMAYGKECGLIYRSAEPRGTIVSFKIKAVNTGYETGEERA